MFWGLAGCRWLQFNLDVLACRQYTVHKYTVQMVSGWLQVFSTQYRRSVAGCRWLQLNLDVLAATVVLSAGLFTLLSTDSDPGDAGLSVSYALQVDRDRQTGR